jgi:hypothetical protein
MRLCIRRRFLAGFVFGFGRYCFYDCGDEAAAATPLASPLVRF